VSAGANGSAPASPGPGPEDGAVVTTELGGERQAEYLESLSGAELRRELAQASALVAEARARYSDALEEKAGAMEAADRSGMQRAKETATARLGRLRAAETRASAIRSALQALGGPEHTSTDGGFEPETIPERFVDVEDFVAHYLSPVVQRKIGPGVTWCPKWWKHPEAVSRLWALWRAFEMFRVQGGSGMSSWWVHHADAHLSALLDERGPFADCRKRGHADTDHALAHTPAPEGWWTVLTGDLDTPVGYVESSSHEERSDQ
jgi:hypothetical protein